MKKAFANQKGFFQWIALVVIIVALIGIYIGLREINRTQDIRSRAAIENPSLNLNQNKEAEPKKEKRDSSIDLEVYDINNFSPLKDTVTLSFDPTLSQDRARQALIRAVKVRVNGLEDRIREDQKRKGERLPFKMFICNQDIQEITGFISLSGPCLGESGVFYTGNNFESSFYPTGELNMVLTNTDLNSLYTEEFEKRKFFKYFLILTDEKGEQLSVLPVSLEVVKEGFSRGI